MSSKTADKEGQESAAESTNSEAMSSSSGSAPAEPIGACYYVDAEGQNRCIVTTLGMCKKIPNSEFHPGKNCPDI